MSVRIADRNAFLAALSPSDYELFRPHLMTFDLRIGSRLQEFGASIPHVIFPCSGLAVMTMPQRVGGGGGAVMMGRDGILGAFGAAAEAPAMCDAEVYISGPAARISASAFRRVMDQSPAIRHLTAFYLAALMMQTHQTALCNAAHSVQCRFVRWLLEVQDRHAQQEVPLTQAAFARVLGVQRTTVTLEAGKLEASGLIRGRRGYVEIVRREQLELHTCECYRNLKQWASGVFEIPAIAVTRAAPANIAASVRSETRVHCPPILGNEPRC